VIPLADPNQHETLNRACFKHFRQSLTLVTYKHVSRQAKGYFIPIIL